MSVRRDGTKSGTRPRTRSRPYTVAKGIIGRLAGAIGTLFVSSTLIFFLVSVSGDPLSDLRTRQPPVPAQVIAAEEARLGLDRPLFERFIAWLLGIVRGDFGPSVVATRDIGTEIFTRMVVTSRLVLAAVAIAFILALLIGTLSALRQSRFPDTLFTPTAFVVLALPSFWLAVLLKQAGIAFNNGTGSNLFATVGASSVPAPIGVLAGILDAASHLVLPTIVLMLVHYSSWSRYHRSAILDSLASDHVRYAVARGLPRRRVLLSHVIRPAMSPIITMVALDLPALFSGAIITETVFQWRGMGVFLLESIRLRDVNAVMGWLVIASLAVVLFNLLADLLYRFVDPRIGG